MSVFIGDKTKRVELAERKDAINPNLLLNSRDFSSNWVIINAEVTSDSYNGGKVVSLHTDGDDINDVRQPIQAMTSQMFTWSVYAKADNAGDKLHTELFGGGGRTDQALTTDWNRYTFQGISDPTKITLYFWGPSGNKGDIQIALPKLEIGNTATSWCPALEDYAWTSDITNLQNTVNNINSTRTPIVAGASGDDLFSFKTNQIRLYSNNGAACKNLPPAANTQWFTVQYIFETPNNDGIAIFRSPANEVWTIGNNGGVYDSAGWVRVANSTDVSNLQSMITGLSTKVDSLQQNSLKIVPITQAAYDALSTKDPNTIYAIGG